MTTQNPFVLDKSEYKRDIDFIRHYIQDVALFISRMTGDPIEKATEFVKKNIGPGGLFELKDPEITYLQRGDNGDREEKTGTFLDFFYSSVKDEEIIASTFTTYLPVSKKKSLLVDFVDENVAARSRAKKAMFAAKMAGDTNLENFKNSEQSNAKIANNSISGAHVSTSTPLYNKTAHSTLTSNCRITSGYGNANNEKMLAGNRHYHHPNIVINNIISIANRSDLDKIEQVMQELNLYWPSSQDAMDVVLRSTRLYWRATSKEAEIRALLDKMRPVELAAFVYVGDLFHIAKFNRQVVFDFIDALSQPGTNASIEDPWKVLKEHREEYIPLAAQLIPDDMKGVDYKKLKDADPKEKRILSLLADTVLNIDRVVNEYASFIKAFFVTACVPASLAMFPTSIRRVAMTSDTDSTIFTVQDWVKWKNGNMLVNTENNRIAAVMIFLAAEAITHILARMSANLGVENKRIHQTAMKNEFKFDVFVPTQVGKHYFAYIGCQEGNLFIDYEMEIKGVHLKSSNVPAEIMKEAVALMRRIMDSAAKGEMISVKAVLERVAEIETKIMMDALRGGNDYYRAMQVKTAASYKGDVMQSNFQHHVFWQEVFGDYYGTVDEPPYMMYKVPVKLPNPRAIEAWLSSIENLDIQIRARDYIKRNNKTTINTMFLPQTRVHAKGIPKEIIGILDMRRAILDCTGVFYIILETLGYYCLDKKISSLASDFHADFEDVEPDVVSALVSSGG